MLWNIDERNKGNLRKLKFLGTSMKYTSITMAAIF